MVDLEPNNEYLVFELDDEYYAIDILRIIEIKSYTTLIITNVMNVPDYILGLTVLNGNIIPIIDLRLLYHLSKHAYNEFTVAIILNTEPQQFAIVIDNVIETAQIPRNKIKPTANINTMIRNDCIDGVIEYNERILMILNVDKLNSTFNYEGVKNETL